MKSHRFGSIHYFLSSFVYVRYNQDLFHAAFCSGFFAKSSHCSFVNCYFEKPFYCVFFVICNYKSMMMEQYFHFLSENFYCCMLSDTSMENSAAL